MKTMRTSLISDVSFILFFAVCVVITIFTASDPNQFLTNMLLLNASFLMAIITYFTTLMTGLILNLLFIFSYGSFIIYQALTVGNLVTTSDYFWLIITPVLTVLSWLFTQANRKLQEENQQLQRRSSSLAMIDEHTQLKNTLSYQQDITTFMALSERYQIPLTLLVVRVKYWDEIRRIISADKFSQALLEVSDINQASVRSNDTLYYLNNEIPTWGIVLFTDISGSEIVVKRIKEKVASLNETVMTEKYAVELQLVIGAAQFEPKQPVTPLELLSEAKRSMEYDVS